MLTPFQTTIIHKVRKKLDLSPIDYIVADHINFICSYKKNTLGIATGNYRSVVAESIGISEDTVKRSIKTLIENGFVRSLARQSIEITEKWQEALSDKSENSVHFAPSISDETQCILPFYSVHFAPSPYIIYIHKIHKICPNLPILTNFSTSFSNEFTNLVCWSPTARLNITDTSKISQKGARGGSANVKKSGKSVAVQACDALFAEFWAAYPRKEKKAEAQRRYRKLAGKHRSIMAALAVYAAKVENTDAQYIKLPTTFLTDYEDYLPSESDLFASSTSSKISQKGGGDVYPDDDEELTAAKSTLRVLAVAIGKAYPDTQDQIKRVSGSAFALVDSDGNRIFDDKAAAWVEEMGGTWAAILELNGPHFDARSAMAWRNAISKTA